MQKSNKHLSLFKHFVRHSFKSQKTSRKTLASIAQNRTYIIHCNGNSDQTVFDIVVKTSNITKTISLQSVLGQSYLTAFSTVLNIEKTIQTQNNGLYFSHQLFEPNEFYNLINSSETIKIKKDFI